jgi:hypothetical protein
LKTGEEVFFTGTVVSVKPKWSQDGREYTGVTVKVDVPDDAPDALVWFGRPPSYEPTDKVVVGVGDAVDGEGVVSGQKGDFTFLNHVRLSGDPEPRAGTAPKAIPVTDGGLPVGTFTVVLNEGERRTLQIKPPVTDAGTFEGWQFVRFLNGPDNDSNFTNFGFRKAGASTVQIKAKYADATILIKALEGLLTGNKEARKEMGVTYAKESGNCFVCGRTLTVPESIDAGIGPICVEKGSW